MNRASQNDCRPPADTGKAALDWAAGTGDADRMIAAVQAHAQRQRRRRMRAVSGIVAGTAVLVGAWLVFASPTKERKIVPGPTRAVISAPRQQTLPDGTVVE